MKALAVEAHALLLVEHRPGDVHFTSAAMTASGIAQHDHRGRRQDDVERPLEPCIEPLERDFVDVDDRQAVEILEPRAQGDELQQIGHDLDVDELAAGDVHQVEQLGVLLERQRDVEMIDALALGDLGDLRRACRAAAGRGSRCDRPRRDRR